MVDFIAWQLIANIPNSKANVDHIAKTSCPPNQNKVAMCSYYYQATMFRGCSLNPRHVVLVPAYVGCQKFKDTGKLCEGGDIKPVMNINGTLGAFLQHGKCPNCW